MIRLKVPYISQEDTGAKGYRNDCGPACLDMLLAWRDPDNIQTVDSISRVVGITPSGTGSFARISQLLKASIALRLPLYHVRPATIENITAEIEAGRPVIALVYYGLIPDRLKVQARYGHFILIVGTYENGFLYHDPDWYGSRRDEGAYRHISIEDFTRAYGVEGGQKSGNMPFQSLFLKES